jgi:hypothetical protein
MNCGEDDMQDQRVAENYIAVWESLQRVSVQSVLQMMSL